MPRFVELPADYRFETSPAVRGERVIGKEGFDAGEEESDLVGVLLGIGSLVMAQTALIAIVALCYVGWVMVP